MATENYLLSIQGSVAGQYNECVLCFQSSGLSNVDTLGEGGDLCNAFIAHGQALWLAMMPSSYWLDALQARRAFPKPSAVAHVQNQPFTVGGTRPNQATSWSCCPAIFLIPPMGVKSGGRVFLPAVSQGDLINNAYLAAYLTAINNFFGAAITGFAGSGTNWKIAIYSRKNAAANLVSSFAPSNRIGFQGRRRKPQGAA